MKNIRIFVSENVQFLEVKVSVYLNRRVFVMMTNCNRGTAIALERSEEKILGSGMGWG